jgi:hypothetical protein
MGNHTAGPWKYELWKYENPKTGKPERLVPVVVGIDRGVRIAAVDSDEGNENPYTLPLEEAKDNARLIAAAPDMLAALENIAGRMRYHLDCGGVVEANEILIACDVAIRAIEKARGA